jgi:hypothetical protein
VIARRMRMLEDFLRRVARHPILSGEHVFHRFLDNEVSWVRLIPLTKYAFGRSCSSAVGSLAFPALVLASEEPSSRTVP